MRFLAQIAQREQQIAQHPERQTDDDIERIDALSAQARAVDAEQDEQQRGRRLQDDARDVAPPVGLHDEQRL